PYPRSRPRRVPRGANLWRRGRMARRLIGLDIGTNAVTIAEVTAGTPPRLDMFAQVALPREAMREGEVADEAAVTEAVARLRAEAGGLEVGAVDLIPLALTRALAHPAAVMAHAGGGSVAVDEGIGAEGIVSFGGGVTAIAVHEDGVPQFVRVLGSGGRELTDAIATDLGVPTEAAEALKRALANPGSDEMV